MRSLEEPESWILCVLLLLGHVRGNTPHFIFVVVFERKLAYSRFVIRHHRHDEQLFFSRRRKIFTLRNCWGVWPPTHRNNKTPRNFRQSHSSQLVGTRRSRSANGHRTYFEHLWGDFHTLWPSHRLAELSEKLWGRLGAWELLVGWPTQCCVVVVRTNTCSLRIYTSLWGC